MEDKNNANITKNKLVIFLVLAVVLGSFFGGAAGFVAGSLGGDGLNPGDLFSRVISGRAFVDAPAKNDDAGETRKIVRVEEESSVVSAVEKVSPAVVSIIVTKDLPIIERYYGGASGMSDFFRQFFGDEFDDFFVPGAPEYRQKGTEKQEVGGGSGFVVSSDGYIITNRHVVIDEDAEYTVLMNDESKHEAKVLARDPINDIAVLKIEGGSWPTAELGDSSNLKAGQSVIAIGNALGEFRNTVSVGVISGLARSVVAGGAGIGSEELVGVIQTDASINPGNSGGPLLNLAGQVIGMNTAMAVGAENIGFAIPANEIRDIFDDVREHGRIIRPWLGVRYVLVNKTIAEKNKLEYDYGAMIVRGENMTDPAVIPGSPADKAGLVENDIILEMHGEKIEAGNPLARVISRLRPGDEITLKISRKGEEEDVKVKLEEMKN